MLAEARYFARMMAGCRRFVRTPPAADPHSLIAHNLARREENFLELMRRVVYANPDNPYFKLFQWAGCGYEELKTAVARDGLEPTLAELRKSGVCLSHDEFKGKRPIERSGLRIEVQPRDFTNPLVRGALETTSSGSRSLSLIHI